MSLLANSNAIETGGYQISRSVRLRSSASAYFNRTPASASNRKTYTFSCWAKRGSLSSNQNIVAQGNNEVLFRFNTTDNINFADYTGGSAVWEITSSSVYRDPSAWYHIVFAVDTTQATSSNRVKVWINNSQVTFTGTYPTLNSDTPFNTTNAMLIGNRTGVSQYFDGYLTEINFIDGQALTPSSFGQTDTITGSWVAKKYTGSHGTNGFFLTFADNSAATSTTIGKDNSGNGNNWTPNNISVTAGTTYDSMLDVPAGNGYADGGNGRGNYCVLNPLDISGTIGTYASGNLNFTKSTAGNAQAYGSFQVTSGKWYCEVTMGADIFEFVPGIITGSANAGANRYLGQDSFTYAYYNNGQKINAASYTAYGNSYTTGNVIGIILDADNGKLYFSKDGVVQNSGDPVGGTGFAFSGLTGPYRFAASAEAGGTSDFNFGQRPFSYTPPTGFKALNTTNLSDPTVKKGSSYFDVSLWTGDNTSSRSITGLAFQPDFSWLKSRSEARNHTLYDAVRTAGSNKALSSSTTDPEGLGTVAGASASFGYVSGFNANGFSVSAGTTNAAYVNVASETYVAWNWKANGTGVTNTAGTITSTVSANTTAGFSIATTTGTGGAGTIGHGLGAIPQFIMSFRRNTAADHYCYHQAIGNTNFLVLNTTAASAASANLWNNTTPTSTVFSVGNTNNNSGDTYVHYIFAAVAGFSAFGSYNGSASDLPFVYTGFRPRYVLIKRTDTSGYSWVVVDTARDTYNLVIYKLNPNESAAENSGGSGTSTQNTLDILSNGFKLRTNNGDTNTSGTYIYAAFAENPFKYSNAR